MFLHDLCKQGAVRIGFLCVRVAFVVRTSGFKGLSEAPISAVLGNNKTVYLHKITLRRVRVTVDAMESQ